MSLTWSLLVFLCAGLAGGLLLGLIGVGMALVAVPLLTYALPHFGVPMEAAPLTAIATSMGVVAIGSVSSAISHQRLGNVDWPLVKTILPFGLVGMAVGSLMVPYLPPAALRWIFAGFLVFVAIDMWRQSNVASLEVIVTPQSRYRAAGGFIGLAGSLIGAGGGGLLVPFLTKHGHSMVKAVATSTVVGFPISVLGTVAYAAQPSDLPNTAMLGHVYLPAFAGISLGSVIAAPLGAWYASRVSGEALKRVFVIALLVLAARVAAG